MSLYKPIASHQRIPKYDVPARVTLNDGSHVFGVVFVQQGQRILDMLCDGRIFFPIKTKDGLSLMNKNSVMKVDIMNEDDVTNKADLFPEINMKYLLNNQW